MFKDDDKHETCYCENCLELQHKLQAKEQECEELKNQWYFSTKHKLVLEFEYAFKLNKYKQALDEIEEYINSFPDFVKEADKIILDIIKKVKE